MDLPNENGIPFYVCCIGFTIQLKNEADHVSRHNTESHAQSKQLTLNFNSVCHSVFDGGKFVRVYTGHSASHYRKCAIDDMSYV